MTPAMKNSSPDTDTSSNFLTADAAGSRSCIRNRNACTRCLEKLPVDGGSLACPETHWPGGAAALPAAWLAVTRYVFGASWPAGSIVSGS